MFNQHHQNSTQAGHLRHGAIALALAALLLPACSTNQPEANAPANENSNTVTTEKVAEDTSSVVGQTVTVRGEVAAVGENAFTIKDEKLFGGESVLVINTTGKPFVIPEDDSDIQVTGEVQQFVRGTISEEYKLALDENTYAEYENKPAIIAKSLALAPTPGELTQEPSQYYGKTLAVTGEVEEKLSPTAFKLNEDQLLGSNDLLVLTAQAQPEAKQDEKVAVTGVLRPFVVAELERDYDLTWDAETRQKLEAEYANKPVLIAREVYPAASPAAAQ